MKKQGRSEAKNKKAWKDRSEERAKQRVRKQYSREEVKCGKERSKE